MSDFFKAVSVKERDDLNKIKIVNGQLITVLDRLETYIDLNGERRQIAKKNLYFFDTERDRINYYKAEEKILYIVLQTNSIYIYKKEEENSWINISGIINVKNNDFTIDVKKFTETIFYRDNIHYSPTVLENSVRFNNNESLSETLDYINSSMIVIKYEDTLLKNTNTITIPDFYFDVEKNLILFYSNDTLLDESEYTITPKEVELENHDKIYSTIITAVNKNGYFNKNSDICIIIL